ncbi:MAG: flagellar hook-associated protein FlgK [Eubacterium sp.]|nr:flagellar hook-associated protein FlgK [Eubacterium sp.]MCI8920029.1 flagellar hook-associated protein FlgK [Eubacterium sp.]
MSSTFFGLNIGYSALNAYSVCTNTVANNVANANTPGYSRQVTNLSAKGALRNYTYGTLGSGVDAESITQMRNNYYDVKYWTNNSNIGQYEKKIYYMSQIENLFRDDDDSIEGFVSIYKTMTNSLESLKGSGADLYIRTQFINNAQSLMEYFNNMSYNLKSLQSDCNQEVRALVAEVNSYAQKIAILNDKINTIEIQGRHANELRDQRAYLIDQLSQLVPVETEETQVMNSNDPDKYLGGTNFRIRLQGQLLVDGNEFNQLECYARTDKVNQNDIEGLYDIRWAHTGNEFYASADTMSGQLKAVLDIRDGNNKENFQGTLSNVDSINKKIYITDPNITNVEGMNMPPTGQITIANRVYNYSSFEMTVTVDEKGNETATYSFELTDKDLSTLGGKVGKDVSIGRAIDARGIPYYMSQMNEFLRSFCRKFNDIQIYGNGDGSLVPGSSDEYLNGGVDIDGNQMGAFFISKMPSGKENTFEDTHLADGKKNTSTTYRSDESNYYYMTAENAAVNDKSMKDSRYFASSSKTDEEESEAGLVDKMIDMHSKDVIYRGSDGVQFLEYIVTDVTVDGQEAEILYSNYSDIGVTMDTYRMSVFSVDEDEEGLDLVKFQNAYNLASKIISTMNQMYDRLITQTGV